MEDQINDERIEMMNRDRKGKKFDRNHEMEPRKTSSQVGACIAIAVITISPYIGYILLR